MTGRKETQERIEVMDLYLACYYVLRGCEIAGVRCIPTGKDLRCSIVVSGGCELVRDIQDEYFGRRARVNLWDFRSVYNQVNGCMHQAKKSCERERRAVAGDAREGTS